MASDSTKGILLVASSALVWSTGGLIVRLIEDADSWTIVLWRSATAVLFLVAYMALRDGRQALNLFARMGWPGAVVGLCYCCASISLVVALKLTTVANVLIIMSSSPLLAAGLGRVVLREPVSATTLLTILGTVLGILLIVWQSVGTEATAALWGNLFALMIAVANAVAVVLIRMHPDVSMTPAGLLGVVMAAIVVAPVAMPWSVMLRDAGLLSLFGVQMGLGLVLVVAGARLIPAAQTALLGTLEPIAGPLWVWVFLDERPASMTLLGGAIVLASLLWHTFAQMRRQTGFR
jgi:drug/metabolite transporter (DMT)-like permease